MVSTQCRLVEPWRSATGTRQALAAAAARADGDFFSRFDSSAGRAFLRLESVVLDMDSETCIVFQRSRGVLGSTDSYETRQVLGAKVKACGLTAGKLNTAIVLLVQQTLDPQLENTGSTAPHEVVIYSLPERPEKAHTLCVQEYIVQQINQFLEEIRGSPVETENDTVVSTTTGLCIRDDVEQPLLPDQAQGNTQDEDIQDEDIQDEDIQDEDTQSETMMRDGDKDVVDGCSKIPAAFRLTSKLPLCKPWQQCPSIPLLPSRFTITTQGSDLTIVSKPNLRALYSQLALIWFVAAALFNPLIEVHTLYFVPACFYLFYLAMETRAIVRSLSVNQVLRVSPTAFSITACYPDSAILRVLSAGMALDGHVADMGVTEHVIGAKVIVSPQPASLPFARSMPPIEIRLQTSRASYNLSRMVGVSMLCHENWARAACMSHRPWVQQDAETLVSAINHHLLALSKECGYCGEKRYTADGVQNVLEASAVSRMHRIGSLFESEASEKQRLGASADLMLQQQRLAIKSLTSEHSGEFLNVLEPREAPLDISQISAEHLDIRSLMFNLRLVAKTSSVRFIFIASVMVFLPILALWLVFVVGSEMRIDYISHNKAMYHWETIREITAIRTALMTSHVVCLSLMVDFYAICMLLIEFVRISGVIVEISKGKWQIKRATRWTLLPRDDGMKYVRRWGVVEKPKGSRVIAHGTVQNLRSCEVKVTPRRFWKGQNVTAVLHYTTATSKPRTIKLLTTETGVFKSRTPATVSDVLVVAQEINRCIHDQNVILEHAPGPSAPHLSGLEGDGESLKRVMSSSSSEGLPVVDVDIEMQPESSGTATNTMLSEISTVEEEPHEQQRLL